MSRFEGTRREKTQIFRTLEDDIELEAECRGKIEFETAEDQLSILTHKLEHEMDELAKLEEEVVKVT